MPQAISDDHVWVGATHVVLLTGQARQADRRGTIRVVKDTKVDILEVYCVQCRRSFEDVADKPCAAAENRDHLIGGPTGERKKRKHPQHNCDDYGCQLGHAETQSG